VRRYNLSKEIDKRIESKIWKVLKGRFSDVNLILNENGISSRDLLDEIHDMFDKSVLDAFRFYRLKLNDSTIKEFISDYDDKIRLGAHGIISVIDIQIFDIVCYIVTNYSCQPSINYISLTRMPLTFREKVVKARLGEMASDQYHLSKAIENRFIDVNPYNT
jgi:hypothetical protein